MAAGLLLAVVAVESAASQAARDQLADMNFEELVEMDIFTAANLLPTQVSKAPGTVYSFTPADFRRFGVRRVDDLLRYVPGIQITQHRKRHQSIWARGALGRYNDKFVLLVDGVRQQQLYYGHFSLGDQFPLEQIDKVEVILGPASSLYGANAYSGLIAITTKPFSTRQDVSTTLEVGNHDRQKVSAFYNSERVQGFASYLDQEAPFATDRRSFIGGDNVQPLDEDYQNIYLKARLAAGLTGKLEYRRSETPFVFIPDTQNAFVNGEFWTAALNYEMGDLDSGRVEASVYYQQENIREYEQLHGTRALGYEESQDATMAGASVTGLKNWGEHTLALGASWHYEAADDTRYRRPARHGLLFSLPETGDLLREPELTNQDYAFFLQDVWTLNSNLSLTWGVRYDYFQQFDDYVNYRMALNYSPSPLHSWKLMYGTGIRTPTLREYQKVLDGPTFEPPIPDAERFESLELGYYLNAGRYRGSLTAYNNRLAKFIYETPTPSGLDEYFINGADRYRLYGVDGLLDVWLTDRLATRMTVGYVDSNSEIAGSHPYIAHWSGSVVTTYQLTPRHELGVSLVYSSKRDDLNTFREDNSSEFVLTNLYLSGEVSPRLSYRLGIDNVLDQRIYDTAASYSNEYNTEKARRQLWLEITWKPAF